MKPSSLSRFSAIALMGAICACAASTPPPTPVEPKNDAPLTSGHNVVEPKGSIPDTANKMKVALLLPLSGESVAIGNSMMDAATLALYDTYLGATPEQIHTQIVLVPKDTGNTPAEAAKAAKRAIDQGASFVIGPLFSQSVSAVAPLTREHQINMLTFSNNRAVAGNGVYVFGFLPELQVQRMAEFAFLHNMPRVAVLAPNDAYGSKVKDTLTQMYAQKGGLVAPAELYAPSPANIDAAVARLAAAYSNTPEERRFQAIFLADGGNQLKTLIQSMKKNNLDLKKIKLLGTGLWDNEEITKIPEMNGAWFSSSPPEDYQIFEKRFEASYGYKPARLSSLAYDAAALAAQLAMPLLDPNAKIDGAMLTKPDGYISPANGLFRFKTDGTAERRLAVMEITPDGFKVIESAEKGFPEEREVKPEKPTGKSPEKPAEKKVEEKKN